MSLLSYTEIKTTVSESNKYVTESGATTTHHRVCNSFCAHTTSSNGRTTDLKLSPSDSTESVSTTLPPMQRKASTWSTMHACCPVSAGGHASERASGTHVSLSLPCASRYRVMSRLASPSFGSSLAWPHACMACPYALEFRANASVPIHRSDANVITAVDFTPQINNFRSRTTGGNRTSKAHQHYIYRAEKEAQRALST